jgi:peptidoglycan DL-endopeptidase LytE
MMSRHAARVLMTAACLLCAFGVVFAQSISKQSKTAPHRKRLASPVAGRQSSLSAQYVVKKGDTLFNIAGSHHTTVEAIKKANQLRSSQLKIGQHLALPGQPATRLAAVKPPPVPPAVPGAEVSEDSEPVIDESPLYISSLPASENASDAESAIQPLRYQLASMGLEFLGVKYRKSGESETNGFDCSGFVKTLFEKFQIALPRSSREQYQIGEKIDKDKLEIGDLIFFASRGKTPSHVGVYIGDDKFLHAALKAKRVLISSLTTPWYTKRFLGARRLLDLWKDDPKAGDIKANNN